MSRMEQIGTRLAILQPLHIEFADDSHLHAWHAGACDGGGHCRLRIVPAQFINVNIA